jgi:sec-independent protein translocase protein TatB
MEILGIGPSELLFIVVLALIILGPRDMQKAGRTIGKWLRQVVTSDGWKFFQQTSREIQTLPNRLMREAALEELKEMEQELRQPLDVGENPPGSQRPGIRASGESDNPGQASEPRILPSPPPPSPAPRDEEPDA